MDNPTHLGGFSREVTFFTAVREEQETYGDLRHTAWGAALVTCVIMACSTLPGLFCVSASHAATPGSTTCETIHDADRRNFCRAVSEGRPSWCEFIKDHDLRAICRVQAKKR